MAAARSWQPLVNGGCSFMTGACSWLRLVRGSGLFITAARPYQLLIQGGGLSMAAVVLLGGRLVRSGVIYWSQCVEGSVVVCIVYIGC